MPKPRAQGLGLATSSEAMAVSLTAVQRPGKLHAFQFQITSHQQIQKNLESQLQFLDSLDFQILDLDSRSRSMAGRCSGWAKPMHAYAYVFSFGPKLTQPHGQEGGVYVVCRMCLILVKQQDWLRSWTSFEFKFLARSRTNLYVHTGLDSRLT